MKRVYEGKLIISKMKLGLRQTNVEIMKTTSEEITFHFGQTPRAMSIKVEATA